MQVLQPVGAQYPGSYRDEDNKRRCLITGVLIIKLDPVNSQYTNPDKYTLYPPAPHNSPALPPVQNPEKDNMDALLPFIGPPRAILTRH